MVEVKSEIQHVCFAQVAVLKSVKSLIKAVGCSANLQGDLT